jgi:hypothetical protein
MTMNRRIALCFLSCAPLLTACFQAIDSSADKGSAVEPLPVDFGSAPDPGDGTIPTLLDTPAIQVVTDISAGVVPGANTMEPCDATSAQARWILMTYCGNCHSSKAPSVMASFGFIDDTAKLLDPRNPTDIPGVPHLLKGNPKGSRIYQRIILGTLRGAMPPVNLDPTLPENPRPNISDYSVLYEWIKSCL